jgi:hypothetical protein
MEKIYIGTKIIAAIPMDEKEFAFTKGQAWDEKRPSRLGYKVRYENGYIAWSPKETFERAYREVTQAEREIVEGPLNA